jgi:mono/diheme cytochrome c family protein
MKKILLMSGLLVLTLLILGGCGSARRGEPLSGPLRLDSTKLVQGQRVFNAHCDQCHPGGEAGLGPALNNKPLPPFLMKIQVRRGLGAMPGFSEKLISDRELDNLIAYTKALRHHR